jgi:hypothetical protein
MKKNSIVLSFAEEEYIAANEAVYRSLWLRRIF